MLVTEVEARQKSCPVAAGHCVASGCMVWRWKPSLTVDNPMRMWTPGIGQVGQEVKIERGYCGLCWQTGGDEMTIEGECPFSEPFMICINGFRFRQIKDELRDPHPLDQPGLAYLGQCCRKVGEHCAKVTTPNTIASEIARHASKWSDSYHG